MVDYKAYLVRHSMEKMLLRHARQLLDVLTFKINKTDKQNILVTNLNVVKSACLLIELTEIVGR